MDELDATLARDGPHLKPWALAAQGDSAGAADRLPLWWQGHRLGSLSAHVWPQVQALDSQAQHVRHDPLGLHWLDPDPSDWLEGVHRALRAHGQLRGWRDERFPILIPNSSGAAIGQCERAAARLWGLLTRGAHATGFVRGPEGGVGHLWLAQRALTKSTDPGLWDNLVGGGVPIGQTPAQALVREAWEEAGLAPSVAEAAQAAGVLTVSRPVPEGWQHEWVHSFDLELPAHAAPTNIDGEVGCFKRLSPERAGQLARSGWMTVDAAIVTLDFLHRHGCDDLS